MSEHSATAEQIGKAGTRLYVITYGGRQEDLLNGLRYIKFMEMVCPNVAEVVSQPLLAWRNKRCDFSTCS